MTSYHITSVYLLLNRSMKSTYRRFKKILFQHNFLVSVTTLLVSIFLGILFVSPQLHFTHVSLTDIDETVQEKERGGIYQTLTNSFAEPYRFRPMFFIERFLLSSLFEYDAKKHLLMKGFQLGLIFYLLLRLIDDKRPSIAISMFFLLFSSATVIDNFWRIGSAEPLYVLLLLSLLICIKNKMWIISPFFWCLFLLSKETAIFTSIIILPWVFTQNRVTATRMTILTIIVTILLVPRLILIKQDPYMSQWNFNGLISINLFLEYCKENILTIVLFIGATLLALSKFRLRPLYFLKHHSYMLTLFGLVLVHIYPLLMFNNFHQYYALPFIICIYLFFNFVVIACRVNTNLIIIATLIVAATQLPISKKVGDTWNLWYAKDVAMVSYLLNNDISKQFQIIYIDEPRIQHISAINYLLSDYGNKTIEVHPSNNLAWNIYNQSGWEALKIESEKSVDDFINQNKPSVLISVNCDNSKLISFDKQRFCTYAPSLKVNVCDRCIVTKTPFSCRKGYESIYSLPSK